MIKGIHATCRAWAKLINTHGFHNSKHGRAGAGSYFWRYHSDHVFAEYLGFSWWQSEYRKGNYNNLTGVPRDSLEIAKKCSLLFCEISAKSDSEVLDLSSGELKENLRGLLRYKLKQLKKAGMLREDERDKAISQLIDAFISEMETIAKTNYKAVIADVSVPKGAGGQIGTYMGASAEAVIARNAGCVTVKRMEEVDTYEYI